MMSSNGQELRIALRHLVLAAKAWGDPADPPMLAVHGWLDNAGSFDHLAPLLRGHYVVAIDLSGHGRSSHRPPGTWYPYPDFLDEIAEVMDQLGWQEADLLGHSLGATLVSVFAAICPQRVRRLVLIEGLGPLATAADKSLEQMRRSHRARATFSPDKLRVFNGLDEAIEARRQVSELSIDAARCIVARGLKVVGRSDGEASVEGGASARNPDRDPDFEEGVQAFQPAAHIAVDSEVEGSAGVDASDQNRDGDPDFGGVQAFHFAARIAGGSEVEASVLGGASDQNRGGDFDFEGVQALQSSAHIAVSSEEEASVEGSASDQNLDGDPDFERVQALRLFSWSSDPALTLPSSTRLTEEQLASILPAITAPTLLLLAEPAAQYLKREVMEARIALVDNIEVVRMEGSHHLHLDSAEKVAAPIKDFLGRHPIQKR